MVSHYAIQPAFDVYAATQDRDLGGVADAIQTVLDDTQHDLPPGATVNMRGQVETMNTAFSGLFFGLAEAIVLIYLLIVVNFHSWTDPFVIVMALPAALAGIAWTLFATHTTLSVPALTGAIMCMGVATANSILVVSFARERLEATGDAVQAAIEAGVTRFRPVLMTALAMIIGMAPMALGLGEGGEQNAPLGRAVIGGLLFATFATLFFVPAVFALVRGRTAVPARSEPSMSPQNDADMKRQLKRAGMIAGCRAGRHPGDRRRHPLCAGQFAASTWTHEAEIPTVSLITPQAGGKGQALILPGTLQAYYDAQLYSRVPGYVHAWYKDIGAHVKKGDVLALIDTPELDQQITQARADLGAAAVGAETVGRHRPALEQPVAAGCGVQAGCRGKRTTILPARPAPTKAAQANLDRLLAMKEFASITAPFDGVVTKRTADIGALVSAGPASNGDPLFAVADIHALRVYVNVPQSYSAQIVPGMTVSLTVPEYPGKTFPAKLVSTSNAISAQSSTLLVEFEADNAGGLLKPGDYAQVSMGLPGGGRALASSRQRADVPRRRAAGGDRGRRTTAF